jgi:hypothetical protein
VGTVSLSNVVLQGYNAGNSYDINWDNLSMPAIGIAAVPEPPGLISAGIALALCGGVVWARRRATRLVI